MTPLIAAARSALGSLVWLFLLHGSCAGIVLPPQSLSIDTVRDLETPRHRADGLALVRLGEGVDLPEDLGLPRRGCC